MQKHQDWIENRKYEHHLNCLRRIKENKRIKAVRSANTCKKRSSVQIRRSQNGTCD